MVVNMFVVGVVHSVKRASGKRIIMKIPACEGVVVNSTDRESVLSPLPVHMPRVGWKEVTEVAC